MTTNVGTVAAMGSDELGDQRGRPGRAVAFDRQVVDVPSDLGCDRLGDRVRTGGLVVHSPAGPVPVEPVADMDLLLEVVPQREVQERAAGGGQFHGGGETALDDS